MSGSGASEIVGINNRVTNFFSGILGWLVALVFFFPVFWMVLTSLKSEQDAQEVVPVFIFDPSFDRYLSLIHI